MVLFKRNVDVTSTPRNMFISELEQYEYSTFLILSFKIDTHTRHRNVEDGAENVCNLLIL